MKKPWYLLGFAAMAVILMGASFDCLRAQPGATDTADPSTMELPIPPEAPLPTPPASPEPSEPESACDKMARDLDNMQRDCDDIRDEYDDAVDDGANQDELEGIVADHRECLDELERMEDSYNKQCA